MIKFYSNTTNVKVKLVMPVEIIKISLNSNTTNVKVKRLAEKKGWEAISIQIQPMLRLNLCEQRLQT